MTPRGKTKGRPRQQLGREYIYIYYLPLITLRVLISITLRFTSIHTTVTQY